MPWREAIDQKAPRRVVRSNMQPVDHSYGIVDICRISEDADHGYETGDSTLASTDVKGQVKFTGLFTEAVLGGANRAFYNGRVFLERLRRLPYLQVQFRRRPNLQLQPSQGRCQFPRHRWQHALRFRGL